MTQTRQVKRSTKPKPAIDDALPNTNNQLPPENAKELYVYTYPISKLYMYDMGQFPVRSCSSNRYIMLAYHVDTNTILLEPFQSLQDRHRIAACNRIMTRLKTRSHTINLQILYNEAIQAYKHTIQDTWVCTFQLVPPHFHLRNIDERSIRTFKAHFLAILSGISDLLPMASVGGGGSIDSYGTSRKFRRGSLESEL